jgi:hypothetical protein
MEARLCATERWEKMGSQTQEEYTIMCKYETERQDLINTRQERREKKDALWQAAKACNIVVQQDELKVLTVAELKVQLRAWDLFLKSFNLPRDGVDVRLRGCKDEILEKAVILREYSLMHCLHYR